MPYDLLGMLVAKTGLTRKTIGSILCGIDKDLKGVEECKIDCATKHFKAISGGKCVYHVVRDFKGLMDILQG